MVITRYFGGVLLGTGGLVRAYTTATDRALEAAEVVTVRSVVELEVTVDYSLYERAALLIQAAGAKLADPQFTDRVTLRWQMPEGTEPPLLEQLRELTRLASLNVAQEAKVSRSISSVRCRTSIRNPHFLFSPPPLARRSRSPCRVCGKYSTPALSKGESFCLGTNKISRSCCRSPDFPAGKVWEFPTPYLKNWPSFWLR